MKPYKLSTTKYVEVSKTKCYLMEYEDGTNGAYLNPAVVIPEDSTAMICGGTILGGDIRAGLIIGGTIYGGTFYGGAIFDGTIYGGRIYAAAIFGGTIYGGAIYSAAIYGGTIYGGAIYDGIIYDGIITPETLVTIRRIRGMDSVINAYLVDGQIEVACGCFRGGLDAFTESVELTQPKKSTLYRHYMDAIEYIKKTIPIDS